MSNPLTVELPALVTIPSVEIVHTGFHWRGHPEPTTVTRAHLESIVQAAQDPIIPRPGVKLGHSDPRFQGEPYLGRLINLRLNDKGDAVIADWAGVPAWLANIHDTAWPSRSAELDHGKTLGYPGAEKYPVVCTGLALLGVHPPAITILDDIKARYGQEEHMPTQPALTFAAGLPSEDIARKVTEKIDDAWAWVTDLLFDDEGIKAIVETATQALASYPVTVTGDQITLGKPTPVRRTYLSHNTPIGDTRMSVRMAASPDGTIHANIDAPDLDSTDQPEADQETAEATTGVATEEGLEPEETPIHQADDAPEPGEEPAAEATDLEKPGPDDIDELKRKYDALVAERNALVATLARYQEEDETRAQARVESAISTAVTEGRIRPAERKAYAAWMRVDPEKCSAQLSRLTPTNPTVELGHSPEIDTDTNDAKTRYQALMAKIN